MGKSFFNENLTFDIEEWFHILDNKETKSISEWNKFDSRIQIRNGYYI